MMNKSVRILFFVISGVLILGVTECQHRTVNKRTPPLCGTPTNRRCCPGSVPTFGGLCLITGCSGDGCAHLEERKNTNANHVLSPDSPKRRVRHSHESSLIRRKKDFHGRDANEMPPDASSTGKRFFRPHISQRTRHGKHHLIPKIGYRTVTRHTSPHTRRARPSSRKSSSDWKEYQNRRIQKNIRRVYKDGKIIVLEKPTEIAPEISGDKKASKSERPRHSDDKSDVSLEKTVYPKTKTTTITPNILTHRVDIAPQADQPLTDLDISEGDEIVLTDLVVDLPDSNSTNQVLKNFTQTVENLGTVCRGDLCLQRQRLLNHSSSFENNRLDPSDVPCPPGYIKVYKENTVICEVYRDSAKRKGIRERNKNRKKNKKKKKKNKRKRTTTVSPSITLDPRPTVSETTTASSPESTTIAINKDGCPAGQMKATRGSLEYCVEDPSFQTTDYPGPCPPGQKPVRRSDQVFCEAEGGIEVSSTAIGKVCPRGQKAVRRNNVVYCEVEGTVEIETTLVTPPDSDEDLTSPCEKGKVPILTSKGFICATSPGTDINTSVDSGVTATACPDGLPPILIDGKLQCAEGGKRGVLLPTNGECPQGYSLTSIDGRNICKRDDFVHPVDNKCPLGFILMNINNKAVCQRVGAGPHIEEDFLKPDDEECPKGYTLVVDGDKSTCKRSYDIIDENTDLIEPIDGICPQYYSLRTVNGKYVCKRKEDRETDEADLELPENGKCESGYSLITYHRKLVCKKDEDADAQSTDVIPPENGQCRSGYSMSTLNRRLVCVKDKSRRTPSGNDGADFVKPMGNSCPPSYILTTHNGEEICRKLTLGIDYVLPESGACPEGSALATVADRLICKKKSKTESDKLLKCAEGQEIAKENGKTICKSRPVTTNISEPDLNCPPGYRTYRGVCEDENLIKILIESENGVRCPTGQHLVERNNMYFCEDAPSEATTPDLTTPLDKETASVISPSSSISSKCPPGQKPIVRYGKESCVPARGDIDITNEILETAKPSVGRDCLPGETEVLISGHRFCQPGDIPNLFCSDGENLVVENNKVFCERQGGVRVEVYLPVCGEGKIPIVLNGGSTCPDSGLPPSCPHGGTLVVRNGIQLCEKGENPDEREATRSPRRGEPEKPETECLPGESKVIQDGRVICQRSGEINANIKTLPFTTTTYPTIECPSGSIGINENGQRICSGGTTHIIRIRGEIKGECPDKFTLVQLNNGTMECQMKITDGDIRSAECPRGTKKIPLPDGAFDCAVDSAKDCPPGYTKIPLIDGNFDCQIVKVIRPEQSTPTPKYGSLDCPSGLVEITENGQRVCKKRTVHIIRLRGEIKGPCPTGYLKVSLRNGKDECQLEITNEDIELIDCPIGYKKLPRSDGAFDCEIDNTGNCPPGFTKIPLLDGNFDCQIVEDTKPIVQIPTPGNESLICPSGLVEITANGRTICKRGTTHIIRILGEIEGSCPDGYLKVDIGNGKTECQLNITDDKIQSIECPTGFKKLPLSNGDFNCAIDNIEDCPSGYKMVIFADGNFDCRIEEACQDGYMKVYLGNGNFDCKPIGIEDCPKGYTRVKLRNGEFNCEIDNTGDCDDGQRKIPLNNGQFECKPDNAEECPDGYKKIALRNGKFDCEKQNIEECPQGYKRISLRNGQFDCEKDVTTGDCPPGQRKITLRDGRVECEVIEPRVACPPGFVRKWRMNSYHCEPASSRGTSRETGSDWVDPSLVECPEDYVRSQRDGLLVCEVLRGSILAGANITCGSNELLFFTDSGPKCEVFRCNEGEELVTISGVKQCRVIITTTPVPICPPDMDVVRVDSGYICRYREVTTTTVRTTTIICPQGEIKVRTDSGTRCIRIQTEKPTTTPAPCAEGLEAVGTPTGVICVYKQKKTTTTSAPTSCPLGQVLMETLSGQTVCGFDSFDVIACDNGQVEVFTLDGHIICKNIVDLLPEENPCPTGLELVPTDTGAECRYKESSIHETHDVLACSPSQILTLTEFGFFCEDFVVGGPMPTCLDSEVVAQVNQRLMCIRKQFADIICEEGHKMVQTSSGFFCEVSQFDSKNECNDGEILLITGSERTCKTLEKNVDLCGDGYKAQRTEDGFVCSSLHLPLECPPGYHILSSRGKPSCYPVDDDKPCLGTDGVPCDNGIKLVPCRPGYDVVEGIKGPECELGDFVEVVCNEENQCVAESCKTGYGTRTCQDLLQLALDGCIPQCSNGGTCINKTCYCPAGVTGLSCEEDIDECSELPDNYCQYGCHNTFGNFECRCPMDSTLNQDGRTCSAIGCIPDCMNGGVCEDGICTCPRGFTGSVCENDIDECKENSGLCEFHCRNTFGSYACICPPGSKLREDQRTCLNTTCIPECKNGGTCENHQCLCTSGYYGVICQLDVNECYGDHFCSHQCINTRGSYRCDCPGGWRLGSDRKTCENLSGDTGMIQDSWQADHPRAISDKRENLKARHQLSRTAKKFTHGSHSLDKDVLKSENVHGGNSDRYQAGHNSARQFRQSIATHKRPFKSSSRPRDRSHHGAHQRLSRNHGSFRRRRPRIHQQRNIHDIARQSQDHVGRFRRPWRNNVRGVGPHSYSGRIDNAAYHGNEQVPRQENTSNYNQLTTESSEFKENLQRNPRTRRDGLQIDSPIRGANRGTRVLQSGDSKIQSTVNPHIVDDVIQTSTPELQTRRVLERRVENRNMRRGQNQKSYIRLQRQNARRTTNRNKRQRERQISRRSERQNERRNARQRGRQNQRRTQRRFNLQNTRRAERRLERQNARRVDRDDAHSGNQNNMLGH